ncbi:hypothetical protein [Nitrosomonas communis]|uniref:hypothetical protein n=1 Tax=Nitrosomonas communis TaxID=44574 RepID=UPI003D275062
MKTLDFIVLALDAIEVNSGRLYLEAFGALEREQFAATIALSIFSFEEAAKYVSLKHQAKRPELPKKRFFKREVKYDEIGELFWYWAIFSVPTQTFEDFKSFASTLPDPDPKLIQMMQGLSGEDVVDFLRYNMFSSEEEMRPHVRKRFPHPDLLDVAATGASGKIEAIRRRVLYVDPLPDLNARLSSSQSIGNDEANKWLKIAFFGQVSQVISNVMHLNLHLP